MFYMLVLAFSLSVDAAGIGLSYGIREIKMPVSAEAVIGGISFLVIFISMTFGEILCGFISKDAGEIIGASILLLIGIWILLQGTKKKEINNKKDKVFNFMIKPLGITIKIIRTPECCDLNKSFIIEPLEAMYLGAALSFDSIGAGITASTFGFNKILFSFLVCLFQILLLNLGTFFGKKANKIKFIDKISNVFSGGILVVIAIFKIFSNILSF